MGATGGTKEEVLTVAQMPSHAHNQNQDFSNNYLRPMGKYNGTDIGSGKLLSNTTIGRSSTDTVQTDPVGGGSAHNNMSPYMVVNYEVVCG